MLSIVRTNRQIARFFVFVAVASLLFGVMLASPLVSGQNAPASGADDNRPLRESELLAEKRALPDYDSRTLWQAQFDKSKMQAAQDLQSKKSGAMVEFDSTSGGVSQVFRKGGYLTEASGGSPLAEVKQFITENPQLFGLSQAELSNFKSVAENRDGATGVTHVYLQQEINGLNVFGSLIKGHVDAEGRLISVEGNYYPNSASTGTGQSVSAQEALISALKSSLPDLLTKALSTQSPIQTSGGNIILAGPAYQFPAVMKPESGADHLTLFDKGPFTNPIRVRQVIFPTADGYVPAWEVDVQALSRQASYVILVNANTGEILFRTNTVRAIGTSKASVFTKNPDETPLSVQNFFGDAVASPSGWSSGFATMGNNVQGDSATSTGDFIYPFTDAWKTAGLNNFDLVGMRIRYTPTDVLATGYTTTVSASAAGSTDPAGTDLLPFYTNQDDGTINLICGGGFSGNVLGANFTSFWVNTNGSVGFGAGSTDPFVSKVSFSNDARRIAGLWRDLNPGAGGGSLTGDCAPEGGGQRIRVVWNAVPNFPSGGSHTFAIVIHGIGTGLDNVIDVDYGAISSLTGDLVGIGGNSGTPFDPRTTGIVNYRDLSAAQSPGIAGGLAQTFPDQDLNLSITNLAYQANVMHDFFYGLGFTEAAGNYQVSNFDKGGAPLDPVQSEVQFGLGVFNNNDFFNPAPDGTPGFLATGLLSTGPGPCRRDSAFDASAIRHEYTHGVSTRMVGGPANALTSLTSLQGAALGEGWSDAGSFNTLNDPVIGAYSVCNPAGLRSAPYNTNPSSYADFGNKVGPLAAGIGQVFIPEAHRDGEIWASALWDIHIALGEPTASKLLFEGLRYTPIEPSMVDARNAMLIADQVTFNGAHLNTLYSIFATRGLGASAATQQGSLDAQPFLNGWTSTVFAAYDTPSNPYGGVKTAVFADDFEGSGPGWSVAGADGLGGGPLWHISARKTSSGTKAFYYGQEGTGDYNTGFRNFGSLVSPQIQLPVINSTQPAITLEWDQFRQTADSFAFDGGFVRIKDVNAGTTTQVSFTQNTLTFLGPTFEHQKINLNAFAGKLIQVEFFMDTFDSIFNAAEGWYIDNVKINALAPAPALTFSSPVYTINETAGTTTITVNRTGDTTPSVSVNYATSNGTATAGADYTFTSGTLTFASGDTTKTFTIPITDDALAEGPETVNIALSNPTGGATLGAPNTSTLIIFDSEAPAPPNAYAVNTSNNLLLFNTFAPQLIISTTPITGLQAGENVLAIDFRPANGQLYALGSTSRLYTINTSNGAATQVGAAGSFTLTGTDFGADFNPVVDRLRVVSDAKQNISINPNDGTLAGTDTNLAYAAGDANAAASANIVAAAYTNNFAGAETTTLYDIDSNLDILVRQGGVDGAPPSPNAGQLTTIGSLGINTIGVTGLDIRAGDNTAYASLNDPGWEFSKLFTINLSTGAATVVAPIGGSAVIRDIALAPAGSFQFGASTASVAEGAGKVTVTVSRSGDTAGPARIDVNTADGTAAQKSDYIIRRATLNFAAGEISKTLDVLIVDDVFVEGPETFTISLSNPSGDFSLDGTTATTVTITDNDSNPAAPNPIDGPGFFVREQYLDFLNREPDDPGLNFWTNEITSCGADASCITGKRVNVSAAFFLSIEFQETGGYAIRLQRTAFGKNSQNSATRVSYLQFIKDTQFLGDGVIIGQAGAEARLVTNKNVYTTQIVISSAFIALYPTALAADPYVTALFASAGVTPTAAEKAAAITAFGAGGTNGRIAALRSVADSNSIRQAEFAPSFVLMQYYGYLRRNPTDAPDGNDNGYQFWLTKLNSFGGDFQKAEMVKAFISSLEYRQRFGP